MGNVELKGLRIVNPEDAALIKESHNNHGQPLRTEREFGRLLRERTKLEITYEPMMFEYIDEEGIKRSTVPDFHVRNPLTGVETYIEISTSRSGKYRQKKVMSNAAPEVHYVVLMREKLEAIQRKFSKYNYQLVANEPVDLLQTAVS